MNYLVMLTIYSVLFNLIMCSYFSWGFVAFGSMAQPDKWTWMAAILIEESGSFYQTCGGSLISAQHILTAAHCLVKNGTLVSNKSIIVRLGQYDLKKKGQDFKVKSYCIHPKFVKKILSNDIALIKLEKEVKFDDRISPIDLPKINLNYSFESENGSQIAFIAGWGRSSHNGEFSDDLIEARMHIYPHIHCQKAYIGRSNITEQHICAKAPPYSSSPSDACRGDSGGPLVQFDEINQKYLLTGVISFGRKCANPKYPGVYSNVRYFVKWIRNKIMKRKVLKAMSITSLFRILLSN